jgi:hypothetical protein
VIAGLKALLASVGRGKADVDTSVDAAKYSMSDYVFHEDYPM